MASPRHPHKGFTLVELVITIAVMLVLLMVAVPSFIALRQRATLQSTGEKVLGVWNQARLEAAKRNSLVKVGYHTDADGTCFGAAVTTDVNDSTPCDCTPTAPGTCDVAVFPAMQSEWRGVAVNGVPTLGVNTGVAVIEPKRTALTDTADAGAISFNGPPGTYNYRLNFLVDQMGRAVLCESTAAEAKMPAYTQTQCGP